MATDQALYGLDNLETGRDLLGPESRWGRRGRRIWAATWPKLLAIALVIGIWQLFYLSDYHGDKSDNLVQSAPTILHNLWGQLVNGNLLQAIGTTMRTAVLGYGLALVFGAVVGALVARIPPLRAATGSIITGLTTMPSIAWFPFAIILFGISNTAILFVVVLGSAPSIANGMISGIDYTPPLLLRAGKVMGLRGLALYRYLILPASLPSFVAGMKQGWAFAWRSLMAGEIVVVLIGGASLGTLLEGDQQNVDLTSAISVMIAILIIGIVVDGVFTKLDLAIRNRRGLLDPAAAS
jgi:NitT/TauT family transport system permease protein